jgi:acetolactate synthase-1/2/3 large subunit
MIKVTDYIVKRLEEYGIKHVFMISGGGAMHLNDSFGKSDKIEYICNHHEQASAIAAEGYSKASGELSVVCVTTGPGGINTLNGVFGQWTDSVPVLYISGQVKTETLITSYPELNLRQLGDQEVDIISLVKPITKYAEQISKPEDVKRIVDEAIYTAISGRKGPVWIDVPMDIQGAYIEDCHPEHSEGSVRLGLDSKTPVEQRFKQPGCPLVQQDNRVVFEEIKRAKRPLIVAGNGINISNTRKEFLDFAEKLQIPVVSTFNGFDIIPSNHPLYVGRIGTIGQRAGNFALQNADLVLFLGTRNNIRQVSYDWKNFAKKAKKIVVDIDSTELNKPTLKPDIAVNIDLREFFAGANTATCPCNAEWLNWCKERQSKYPVVLSEYKTVKNAVNPYYFIETLTNCLKENSITVLGNGTASVCGFQASVIKENQKFILNSGDASMGYDLPAAIGACIANDKKEVICVTGDGSIMMNLQELQTVLHYKLPIKIFILNNDGYISIKQTQNNFFEGRMVASGKDCGVSCPDFIKVAESFGLEAMRIYNQDNLEEDIKAVLFKEGAVVCEVMLQSDYIFSPKHSSQKLPDGKIVSKPLEDMFPFLDREEFMQNILDED